MNKPIREPCWICEHRWNCPTTNKGRGKCKDFREERKDVFNKDRNISNIQVVKVNS